MIIPELAELSAHELIVESRELGTVFTFM